MIRKSVQLVLIIMVLAVAGCIKETYDMNKVSSKMHLSPTMAISAFKGGVTLSDMVKSNDTVVFDQNKFVKIVFKKDSVINLKLADYYDLSNMVAFTQTYKMGDLVIDPFSLGLKYSVSQIASHSGTSYQIPTLGSIDLGKQTFSFTNFENAVFSSGTLNISITNNLPANLNSISVTLYHGTGATPPLFVPAFSIPAIAAGGVGIYSISLADKTLNNPISASVVLSGIVGTSSAVPINANNSNIQVTISGSALKVKSGRVKLPSQSLLSVDNKDTISFNPGTGVEIDKLQTTTGNLSYHIQSTAQVTASLTLTLPTAKKLTVPVSKLISISPSAIIDGTIPFDNVLVDMSTITAQPFNKIPLAYSIDVNSNNAIVNFNSTDKVQLDLKLLNPVLDYVKGYFGQMSETIAPDSLNLDIEDILSHLTGTFLISSPSIKINYSNSFAIPIQVAFDATGRRQGKPNVNLGLSPFNITSGTFATRDISASYTIDKNNSSLPALISMPPDAIRFSGTAKMNPAGNNGLRDNYVFGNSRFLGSVEVEVPLEFKINVSVTDTIDNFLKSGVNSDSPVKPENFKMMRVDLNANNGFPLGISIKMSLYDSATKTIKNTIDATDLLKAAPVDANGKSNGATESTTKLEFTKAFFSSISSADKIILTFGLQTSENGTKDVKIYSDNRIDYNAALVVQPDIVLK